MQDCDQVALPQRGGALTTHNLWGCVVWCGVVCVCVFEGGDRCCECVDVLCGGGGGAGVTKRVCVAWTCANCLTIPHQDISLLTRSTRAQHTCMKACRRPGGAAAAAAADPEPCAPAAAAGGDAEKPWTCSWEDQGCGVEWRHVHALLECVLELHVGRCTRTML